MKLSIILFNPTDATIKDNSSSPTSEDDERIIPFTRSPLENCFCSKNQPIHVGDDRKKDAKSQRKGKNQKR